MDVLAVGLGSFLIVVGITHFLVPRYYLSLVPPWVPQARLVVFGSGLVEIAIGMGLLFEGARPVAAWGAAALMAIYVGTHMDALLRARADEDRWLDRPAGAAARVLVNLVYLAWAGAVALTV